MAQTGEEVEVLCLQRVRLGIENGQVWRGIGEKRLFKLLQHLQGDFERVLKEPEAAAVMVVGAGRLLDLAVPQLRATTERFRPALVERLGTRTPDLEALVRGMYVRGLSTQDVSRSLWEKYFVRVV